MKVYESITGENIMLSARRSPDEHATVAVYLSINLAL